MADMLPIAGQETSLLPPKEAKSIFILEDVPETWPDTVINLSARRSTFWNFKQKKKKLRMFWVTLATSFYSSSECLNKRPGLWNCFREEAYVFVLPNKKLMPALKSAKMAPHHFILDNMLLVWSCDFLLTFKKLQDTFTMSFWLSL